MRDDRSARAKKKKARLAALLYLAEQDAAAARLLAAHGNRYAAYHCQQASEKLIRTWLIQHDVEPGLDHHLDILVGKLPEGEPWKARLAPLHKYTLYATTYRYATPGGRVPDAPEATAVASDAAGVSALIADASRQLGVDDDIRRSFPKTDNAEVKARQQRVAQEVLEQSAEVGPPPLEKGRELEYERLYERRLGRALTEGELATLRERWGRLGAERLGDVLVDSSVEALAAWLADPDAR